MTSEKRTSEASGLDERAEPVKVTKTAEDQKDVTEAAKNAEAPADAPEANGQEAEGTKEETELAATAEPKAAAPADEPLVELKDNKAQPDESLTEPAAKPVPDEAIKTKPPVESDEPAPTAQEA